MSSRREDTGDAEALCMEAIEHHEDIYYVDKSMSANGIDVKPCTGQDDAQNGAGRFFRASKGTFSFTSFHSTRL
jgi:hypothetical protein